MYQVVKGQALRTVNCRVQARTRGQVGVGSWAGTAYLSRSCKRSKKDSRESGLHVEQEGWRGQDFCSRLRSIEALIYRNRGKDALQGRCTAS